MAMSDDKAQSESGRGGESASARRRAAGREAAFSFRPCHKERGDAHGFPPFLRKKPGKLVFAGIVILLLLLCAGAFLLYQHQQPRGAKQLIIESAGGNRQSFSLEKDGRIVVRDGKAMEASPDINIAKLLEEDPGSVSDINILEIKAGTAACVESNCSNQVCVHTNPLKGESYEVPIVCLPHGMVAYIEGTGESGQGQ